MPQRIIAGNWKMHTTVDEAVGLAEVLRGKLTDANGVTSVLCPPFVSLTRVGAILKGSPIRLGAQNAHPARSGAFTGEVSVSMLRDLCEFVIVGHSERRAMFGETDAIVAEKVQAVAEYGMRPILCVGEAREIREGGRAETFVSKQLRDSLGALNSANGLVVAYEPIWAIGTGLAATPEIASAMAKSLRSTLADAFGSEAASATPILYGGSVNPGNAEAFVKSEGVDGALVGGASLKPNDFTQIVEIASAVFRS